MSPDSAQLVDGAGQEGGQGLREASGGRRCSEPLPCISRILPLPNPYL